MEGLIGLAGIRKSRGYTQLKVAMALNISREALSYYENGKRSPDHCHATQNVEILQRFHRLSY